jgi:hypothetical protein
LGFLVWLENPLKSITGIHMAKQLPKFKGLSWHRNQYYSFFVPIDWQKLDWPDGRSGVIYTPPADDPLTLLAVELRDLGMEISADDLDDLKAGFLAGIEELPECQIETHEHWVEGKLICLMAKYTFAEQDTRRKRWVRQFYHQTRQIAMTAQGATCEAFDYWLPMFYEAMMTTRIHNTMPEPDADMVSSV